ncbi:hypothetical protein ACS0TY_016915 [Phlomoides rotata]
MSDKCSSCDCADRTQCPKKGYTADIIETEKSYTVEMMVAPAAAENDGKYKCGADKCADCTCDN